MAKIEIRDLKYEGSSTTVSAIIHECNSTLGFPTSIKHGALAHVFAEFNVKDMLCTLFTTKAAAPYTYVVHVHFIGPDVSGSDLINNLEQRLSSIPSDEELFKFFITDKE